MSLNRGAVWPFIIVAGLLALAAWGGLFSWRGAETPPQGDLSAGAAKSLLGGLAEGVLAAEDTRVRGLLHPALLARLPSDRPLAAQMRDILPEPPVLAGLVSGTYSLQTLEIPASAPAAGTRRVRLAVDIGAGARFEAVLLAAPDAGRWKLLGLSQ